MAPKGAKDEFVQGLKCVEKRSLDSPTEPFKSMYKAGEHFTNALNTLKSGGREDASTILAQAHLLHQLGEVEEFTEEPGQGTEKYKNALDLVLLLPDEITPKRSVLHITLLNRLAIIDSQRDQLEESIEKLKQAEDLYNKMRDMWATNESIDAEEHPYEYFGLQRNQIPRKSLNSLWIEEEGTKTKHYLAQCYQHTGEKERAAMYCHLALKKQLKNREFLSFYEPVDWALNASTLSQFFLFRGNYTLALHLLACSEHMMDKTKAETAPDDMERIKWRSADVARCWIKYAVELLQVSKNLKMEADEGKTVEYPPTAPMPVKLIDDEEVESIERRMKSNIVKTFEEAREVFLEGQKRVTEATSYYSLQNRASDYVLIALDLSELYRNLAAFETEVDRTCKMHKRRLDILEEIVKTLNPKYYSAELQQVHFKIAEGYFEMLEFKYSGLPKGMLNSTAKPVKKINTLKFKSMMHYKEFLKLIESFVVKDSAGIDNIGKYEDSYVRPALVAHFSIGRLESKGIVGHPREQLENLEKSKKQYEYVDAYLKKYPEHVKYFEVELPVLKEIMELWPQTIQNVMSSTLY